MTTAEELTSPRLALEPLCEADADEMVGVLDDDRLHEFIGGRPLRPEDLRARFAALVAGSSRPGEDWLNWIVRRRSDRVAVGTVQATLTRAGAGGGGASAEIAWVVGVPWQGQGFASEAAVALVAWLRGHGAGEIVAHIHPDHGASEAVARRAGLQPTGDEVDGEQVWRYVPVPG
jgi:RimJ/RimL family protein N-acetyltransferase